MTDEATTSKKSRAESRRQRLAAALRDNLGKRKAQARARAAAEKSQAHRDLDTQGES
jgi:hypothetical protein